MAIAAAQSFKSVSQVVTAIQWRGDNLAEVQAALAPSSPLFDGRAEGAARILTVMVRDHNNEKLYASLGRQVKGTACAPGDWLVWVGEDDVRVVGAKEFEAGYVAIAPERYLVEAVPIEPVEPVVPQIAPPLPAGWVQPPVSDALAAFESESLKEA